MPNGFEGSESEWQLLESGLITLDTILERFALEKNLLVTRNYHDWPSRQLTWKVARVTRAIQLVAEDRRPPVVSLWLCAWTDRLGPRYLRREVVKEKVGVEELWGTFPEVLSEAYRILNLWVERDLHPAS